MKMLAGLGMMAVIALASACSSSDDSGNAGLPAAGETKDYVGPDANHVCDVIITQCPQAGSSLTLDQCKLSYGAMRVPQSCADKLESLSCTSTTADIDSQDCFPKCTGTDFTCDGTHLTQCGSSGTLLTVDCNALCTGAGATWTGTCGLSFGSQTSTTAKCWCS